FGWRNAPVAKNPVDSRPLAMAGIATMTRSQVLRLRGWLTARPAVFRLFTLQVLRPLFKYILIGGGGETKELLFGHDGMQAPRLAGKEVLVAKLKLIKVILCHLLLSEEVDRVIPLLARQILCSGHVQEDTQLHVLDNPGRPDLALIVHEHHLPDQSEPGS